MNQLSNAGHGSVFESVKNVDGNGVEYWLARDFQRSEERRVGKEC